ncbi:uncharacterized protein [Nicotiana tomentosiformis]|uniref:uncharacterized protein n=1 Tax=Nicotiana tomentosiformis TaxID=4098 RepID=UPI00051B1994|nr:uncharacterized protein LOC117281235 [Nicotiana tomentosiformis]
MPMTRKATASQKGNTVADEGTSRASMFSEGQSETPRGSVTPSYSSPIFPAPEVIRRNPVPPLIAHDEDMDMQSTVQLLNRLVAAQAQHQRTLRVMHASDTESVELASYRLRDVAVQWYETWEFSRGTNAPPAVWEEFSGAFLRHYLSTEIRQARVDRFLALKQGNMSVREYSLQFDSLASMDISRIQTYAQNLEDRKRQQYENCDEGQRKKARSARQPEEFLGDPMPPYPVNSVRQL